MDNNFWIRVDELKKCTMKQMCNDLGLNEGSYKQIRHYNRLPSVADTLKISDYLGVPLDYLVTGRTASNDLTQSELELISNYRNCPPYVKTCIEMTAKQGCNTSQSVTTVTQKNLCG